MINYEEFGDRFDVLFNNITSNQAPGLNTYEKSVLLTKAQDEVIKNHFLPNSQGNTLQQGFDGNQKRQIDFSTITAVYSTSNTSSYIYDSRAESITLPSDVMMFINESVSVTRDSKTVLLNVVPISFDEYNRLMSKPFKRPVKYQAWRLILHSTDNKADIICGPSDTIGTYSARYIRRPKPIIIGDLDGLTINGYEFGEPTDEDSLRTKGCELDGSLHEEILQRAVELAKVAWTATGQDNLQPMMEAGKRSE